MVLMDRDKVNSASALDIQQPKLAFPLTQCNKIIAQTNQIPRNSIKIRNIELEADEGQLRQSLSQQKLIAHCYKFKYQ